MLMQHIYMPFIYRCYVHKTKHVRQGLVIFADSHTKQGCIPFSMQRMYEQLSGMPDCQIELCIADFGQMGYVGMLAWIKDFMRLYAAAQYVFICDNFLPASSCKKRKETTLVQLWHSGGILKKSGYDTKEDIPSIYKGSVYKNYDMVTVSAPALIPIFTNAMRLREGVVKATGISRSDFYFDKEWNEANRSTFYEMYPEAKGKKVILWAPTFRGNAGMPALCGMEDIKSAIDETKDSYFWVIKLHPHLEGHGIHSNCPLPSEQLLYVADLMITDYSSILFDYMAYEKPFVLFAPDFAEYERTRGFYLPYETSYPTTVALDKKGLLLAISDELAHRSKEDIRQCYAYHMAGCDGHATERILDELGLYNSKLQATNMEVTK